MVKKASGFTGSLVALIACALAGSTALAAEPDMFDGQWHYALTPYAWFPTIYSTSYLALPPPLVGRTIEVQAQPSQYLSSLKFGFALDGTARKGDWSIATDILYMRLGAAQTHARKVIGPAGEIEVPTSSYANLSVDAAIWSLVGGYNLVHNSYGTLDVIAGARYAGLKTSVDVFVTVGPLSASGSPDVTKDLTDGIVGIMGNLELGEARGWYVPYEFDIGGKSGNVTYNAQAGVGYRMSWGNVMAGYRELKYRFSGKNQEDVRFSGPAIAATFLW